MQASLASCTTVRPQVPTRGAVRCNACAKPENKNFSRRSAAAVIGLVPALVAGSALAKDAEETRRAAEERKAALRAAATGMKETGNSSEVFKDSKYAVSEDKSPNVHTRQEEGVRKSGS